MDHPIRYIKSEVDSDDLKTNNYKLYRDVTDARNFLTFSQQISDRRSFSCGEQSPPNYHNVDKSLYLPPCKVCSGRATGFHYGANTCEACKAFFRRYNNCESNLKPCKQEGRCAESVKNGKILCAKCRYTRCIKVGMTKEGIKKGRYTYEKRYRDVLEIQRLRSLEMEKIAFKPEISENLIGYLSSKFESCFQDLQHYLSHKDAMANRVSEVLVRHSVDINNPISQILLSSGKSEQSEEHYFYEDLEKLYSQVSQLSQAARESLQRNSGKDLSEANKIVWLGLGSQFESCLMAVTKYVKAVPGFTELPIVDQITLLQAANIEVLVLLRALWYQPAVTCLARYCSQIDMLWLIPLEMLNLMLDEDFCNFHQKLTRRIYSLDLGVDELCILIALVVMSHDKNDLTRPELVADIHENLISAFQYCLKKKHQYSTKKLANSLLILPMLRQSSEVYFSPTYQEKC